MTLDEGKHQIIRRNICGVLENDFYLTRNKDYFSSHDSVGDIKFTYDKIEMSEPDIVILKDGKALAIEIELSTTPKHLFGVVFANYHSKNMTWNGTPYNIDNKSILIIIDTDEINKPRSGKPFQVHHLTKLLKEYPGLSADIITQEDAHKKIKQWLQMGELVI